MTDYANEKWHEIGLSRGGRVRYSISDMGRCKRVNTLTGQTRIDHGTRNRYTGYWTFANLGYVHRLVASSFLKNDRPDIWTEVDHINSNRDDNSARNLRYVDIRFNRSRRHAKKLRRAHHRHTSRKGMQLVGRRYDAATNTWETKTWNNQKECSLELGCSHVLVYLAALREGDPSKRSVRTAKGWRLQWVKREAGR